MEIRKITEQDLQELKKLLIVAFEFGWENEEPDFLLPPENEPRNRRDRDYMNRFIAAEEGKILSSVASYDYTVWFDGGVVGMGGVGDVSTFPQCRRRGAVRECMKAAFNFMHERGQALSYLYPFSTAFYAKLGYGLGYTQNRWDIPMNSIRRQPDSGHFELLEPGMDITPLKQVYEAFTSEHNLAVQREDIDWKQMAEVSNWKHQEYTYLYWKEDGQLGGYFTMKPEKEREQVYLSCCRNFLFDGREALGAMLSFMKGFAANYDAVRVWLPEEWDISPFVSEFVRVKWIREVCGMARVIDVAQILKQAKYLGEGSAVIRVLDDQCPWNDKAFQVDFAPQGAEVSETDRTPDIEVPMELFSQWMIGRYESRQLTLFKEFEQAKNKENLKKVFYKKDICILDGF